MSNFKQKIMFLCLIVILVVPMLDIDVQALGISNKPVIKSVDAYTTTGGSSRFKIYLEKYHQNFLKVQQEGNRFKTKVYIFEEDNVILQPEGNEYKADTKHRLKL